MRNFDVTVMVNNNGTWEEQDLIPAYIQADDEAQAVSVAKDILMDDGYTADEIEDMDFIVNEK